MPLNEDLPQEVWSGKKVSLSHLKVFRCLSYVHVDVGLRSKFDVKPVKYTFIGYSSNKFGYKFWDYENHKFIRSKNITFKERKI